MKSIAIILLLSAAEFTLQEENPCKLPADPGPCRGKHSQYYYDWDSQQCAEFTYGGCEGNDNNFDSIEECEAACPGGEEHEDEDPCELPADSGPCRAHFVKYYYNKESNKCDTFVYGGCEGNDNRFDTVEECEAKCAEEEPAKEPCKLPADPGPCKGKFPRYYYDWDSKQCAEFTYGGCRGNENNYDSIADGPCMAY
ncbi:Kunitz BPTI domain containing protein, partial [Trichuris trichiura]